MLLLSLQVLCDASLFDAGSLAWKLREPTPFARCAHTAVALPSGLPLVVLSLCEGIRRNAHGTYEVPGMAKRLHSLEASSKTMCCSGFPAAGFTPPLSTSAASLTSRWCAAEAGCSGNQQSDTDEPMGTGEEAEHMCVLVYGGFSGDAVEGDLISIDPGVQPTEQSILLGGLKAAHALLGH